MISVAGGLALEGFRPVVESYAPVRRRASLRADQARARPPERRRGARQHRRVLRCRGGGPDAPGPEDVALIATLPGWTIHVPGHRDEVERLLWRALATDDRVYLRLSDESNVAPVFADGLSVLRRGADDAPLVVAVGPTLDQASRRPPSSMPRWRTSPRSARSTPPASRSARGSDVVLVEPYLAGIGLGGDGCAARPPAPTPQPRSPQRRAAAAAPATSTARRTDWITAGIRASLDEFRAERSALSTRARQAIA